MATLTLERRLVAFRATDSFAVEAYRAATSMRAGPSAPLADEIRRTALAAGGAVVAASASEGCTAVEREHLARARSALIEGRYYLYLARRFGLIDGKLYRTLTMRQDSAIRELEAAIVRAPQG